MDRRTFLGSAVLTSAAAAIGGGLTQNADAVVGMLPSRIADDNDGNDTEQLRFCRLIAEAADPWWTDMVLDRLHFTVRRHIPTLQREYRIIVLPTALAGQDSELRRQLQRIHATALAGPDGPVFLLGTRRGAVTFLQLDPVQPAQA